MTNPTALLSSSGPFSQVDGADWAVAWIDYLFHRTTPTNGLEIYAGRLAPIADGLRHALGLYSMGMLVLAGILLFYHLATMIAETAQYGVAFGRRTNQIWAPIRLVSALILLVPVGSGLSAGQYLVIKIAEEGSTLASNAWRTIAASFGDSYANLVTPHAPDFAGLATTATEMELCRLIYQKLYEPLQSDPTIHLAGDMGDALKTPLNRFTDETWRSTNSLNAATPFCGEYRFSGYRHYDPFSTSLANTKTIDRMSDEGAAFSHTQTNILVTQAQALAARTLPTFSGTSATFNADIHNDLNTLIISTRDALDTRWHTMTDLGPRLANQALAQSTEGGWIAAATFIPDMLHVQESYGEMASHILPNIQGPVLAHPAIAQQALLEAMNASFPYPTLTTLEASKLQGFYSQVSKISVQAHEWIYSSQLPDTNPLPITSFDLRDRLNAGTEPEAAAALFAHAVDAKAIEEGVWGIDPTTTDSGYPFSAPTTDKHNPLAVLAEFGRRQYALGVYLVELAGSTISVSGAAAPAALVGIGGFFFLCGGLASIFLISFLPFARFLLAVLTWLLNLFEAVVAMPVVAIAHLTPSGEGLSGGTARQAYVLWIGLMIRPLLSLLGLVAGLLIFDMGMTFLGVALIPFARLSATTNSGLLIVANVSVILIYDILAYAIANTAFKGIYLFPDYAMRWISQFVVADGGTTFAAPPASGTTPTSLFSALAHAISNQAAQTSATNSTTTKTSGASSSAAAAKDRSMKTALFPTYRETTAETATNSASGSLSNTSTGNTSSGTSSSTDGRTVTSTGKDTKAAPSQLTNKPFFPDKQ